MNWHFWDELSLWLCCIVPLQVADEVEGALLYVDEGAGEALHYIGGLPFVLQLGVRAVCSLENASALDAVNCNFRFLCASLDLISSLNEFLL